MSRSRVALILSLALWVTVAGCSTERPTEPIPLIPLRAIPIGDPLVIASSENVDGILRDSNEYLVNFSESDESLIEDFDDIAIYCGVRRSIYDSMQVFDNKEEQWRPVGGALWTIPICYDECWGQVNRLLSQMPGSQPSDFFRPGIGLRLIAPKVAVVGARLVKYSDAYQFVTIQVDRFASHAGMAARDGILYVYDDYTGNHDSILAMSQNGEQLWARHVDEPGTVTGSAFDGSAFWNVVWGLAGDNLDVVDTLGQHIGWISGVSTSGAMTWAKGNLWYANSTDIYELDADSSLLLGTAVVQRQFRLYPHLAGSLASDSLGLIVFSPVTNWNPVPRIYRYTYDGVVRDSFDCSIGSMKAIAWDGNSLYALHHGPSKAITGATLLSRFSLE